MKSFLLISALVLTGSFSSAADVKSPQIVEIKSTLNGFEPSQIEVSSESPVILKVTRTTDETCATDIRIKDKKIDQKLPLNETVTIDLGKLKKGELKFNCSMNMIRGTLKVK